MIIALDETSQLLRRVLDVELWIVLDRLHELVVALNWREVLQHVDDEALLGSDVRETHMRPA